MNLSESEKEAILEEAQKAKNFKYCKRIETWISGQLAGITFEWNADKDALKKRLYENT